MCHELREPIPHPDGLHPGAWSAACQICHDNEYVRQWNWRLMDGARRAREDAERRAHGAFHGSIACSTCDAAEIAAYVNSYGVTGVKPLEAPFVATHPGCGSMLVSLEERHVTKAPSSK